MSDLPFKELDKKSKTVEPGAGTPSTSTAELVFDKEFKVADANKGGN
jgi:hypothetical protein